MFLIVFVCINLFANDDFIDKNYNVIETKNIYLTPSQIYEYYQLTLLKNNTNYSDLENNFKNSLDPNYKPNLFEKIKMINLNYIINDNNLSNVDKNDYLKNILNDKENTFIISKGDLLNFKDYKISNNDLFLYNDLIKDNILDKILSLKFKTNLVDKELLETKLIAINLKNKTFEFNKNEEIKLIITLNKALESLIGFEKLEEYKSNQFDKNIIYENYENFLDFVNLIISNY